MKTRALVLFTLRIASPAFGGDATEGAMTARKRCAGWRHITNDPQRAPESLRNFLVCPHGNMSQIALTQRQINNLVTF
jgi:hypothetical protein